MDQAWVTWVLLAAAFIIGEIFTAGFFILWFGIGAAAAAVAAYAGLSGGWQWAVFVVVSTLLIIVSRPFAERISKKQPPGIGADRYVGKEGIVTEEIDNLKNKGRVKVEDEDWRARSEGGDLIPVSKAVKVVNVEGTRLTVRTK